MSLSAPIPAPQPARISRHLFGTRAGLFHLLRESVEQAVTSSMVSGAVGASFSREVTVTVRLEALPLVVLVEPVLSTDTDMARQRRIREALLDDIFIF